MKKKNTVWSPHPGAQVKMLTCPAWEVLLHGNRGGGKQMLGTEKVLTSKGWRMLKHLSIGELVCSRDGRYYPITGIFPQGIKQVWILRLQDGREIPCGDEHLWTVYTERLAEKVLSTETMYNSGLTYAPPPKSQYKFRVPNCKPVLFSKRELPIDPYILGCLLGNGTLTGRTPRIATSDPFILDYFRTNLSNFKLEYDSTSNNYTIVDLNKSGEEFTGVPLRTFNTTRNRLTNAIEFIGVNHSCKYKSIPYIYKHASIDQRMEILRGLIDTDGSVTKYGSIEFSNTSIQLILDTSYICRSLGIRCTISEDTRDGEDHSIKGHNFIRGKYYRLYINTSLPIAKTPNKLKNILKKKKTNSEDLVSVVDIQKTDRYEDMICISIDSPDHTFITKDFIVTHNTDCLLMDFAQEVGVGHGADYKGLILREATTELGDIIAKSKKWFPRMFPGARFNENRKIWTFPAGEMLWFNYARVLSDYDQYHGSQNQFIGWEELANQAVPDVYLRLMSCNRTSNPNIPLKYRATTNPNGPGHGWIKERFINSVQEGRIFSEDVTVEYVDKNGMDVKEVKSITRTHIFSDLTENTTLLKADPLYRAKIHQMTQDNDMLRDAWVHGSWDLVIGGFFSDVWHPKKQVLKNFPIPRSWQCYRSFDWGSSKPWAVTYFAECNGDQPNVDGLPHFPVGSIVVINEIYGWTGKVNEGDQADSPEIARRVLQMDNLILIEYGLKVSPGPADNSIYDVRDGTSIGIAMSKCGLYWTRSHKGSGSRIAGWAMIRQMLGASMRGDLEVSHLYFLTQAHHHIRTIPLLQRDPKKPEDVNCFVKNTLVDTPYGEKYIQDICEGDLVCTPIGDRVVLKSGASGVSQTIRVILSDGNELIGTGNHKIFVRSKGLVALCNLEIGDTLCQKSSSYIKVLNSQVEMENILNAIHHIVHFLMEQPYYTEQNGRIILEKFQRDFKSIIEMERNLIIVLGIFNSLMERIILDSTLKKDSRMEAIFGRNLKNGENLRKVLKYFRIILSCVVRILPKENVRALIVVFLLLQNIQQRSFVQSNVWKIYLGKLERYVRYVGMHFLLRGIIKKNPEPVVMLVDGNYGERTVYNLTSEQSHLYYANGILVSNTDSEDHCGDSMRYGLTRKMFSFGRKKVGL